jgi:hypothetical protein
MNAKPRLIDVLNGGPEAARALTDQQVRAMAYGIENADFSANPVAAPTHPQAAEAWQVLRLRLRQIEATSAARPAISARLANWGARVPDDDDADGEMSIYGYR